MVVILLGIGAVLGLGAVAIVARRHRAATRAATTAAAAAAEATGPREASPIDLAYWNRVIRATIGTAQLCSGRPNPVDVAYRLGRTGAADVPEPGKELDYALPIALAVAVGREEAEGAVDDADDALDDPEATIDEFVFDAGDRGPVTFFRIAVEQPTETIERSIAVARLPKAIADKASRRLLLFAANRRAAMSWDAHDMSDLWGGVLQEQFTVNTGYPAGARKVLTPRMVEHLVTTRADGWMMAGEWLFVHRQESWTDDDRPALVEEMLKFLDLLPPAPRPSNEPLAFRAPLDQWERELVTLLQAKERGGERRGGEDRRQPGDRRATEVPDVAAS